MPIIIRNGVMYGATPPSDSANEINYSNSTSGLESTNVQNAIDELASRTVDPSIFEEITDDELDAIIETDVTDVAMIYTYDTETTYNETEEMISVENVTSTEEEV